MSMYQGVESRKAVIKHADMPKAWQDDAIALCSTALGRHTHEKDIAGYIKREFDRKYGPLWHCVVGKSFGSLASHAPGSFIYFFFDKYAVMLFKAG